MRGCQWLPLLPTLSALRLPSSQLVLGFPTAGCFPSPIPASSKALCSEVDKLRHIRDLLRMHHMDAALGILGGFCLQVC